MTYQEIMDAARNAHAQGDKSAAARLVRMGREIIDQAERRRPTPEGYSIVGNDENGGTVYRSASGALQYVSPSVSKRLDALPDDLNSIAGDISAEAGRDLASEAVKQHPIAARANSAITGVPFAGEWADEVVGAVSPTAQGAMRLASEGMAQDFPKTDMALRVGGGVASAIPMMMAMPAKALTLGASSTAGRMVGGGIMGAAAGGTDAALSQAGANNTGDRLDGVGQAMAVGGILGGALGVAAEPAAKAVSAIYKGVAPGVAANVRKAKSALGINGAAMDIVADMASRDAPYAAENFAKAGRFATVASGGPNSRKLLDWAVNRPGAGSAEVRNSIGTMADEAADQFRLGLDDAFGPPVGPRQAQADIMAQSSGARSTAYDSAYAEPIDFASEAGEELLALVDRVPTDVMAAAHRLMETEGNKSAQILINAEGVMSSLPDVRTLDYITRALRDKGDFGVGEGKEQGRAFMKLASEMRRKLDTLVPEYGAARASGADAIAKREAVTVGRDAFSAKMTTEDLQMEIASMQPGEIAFVKQGVRSYVQDLMDKTKVALTDDQQNAREVVGQLKTLLSTQGKNKLSILLGKDAPKFIKMMEEVMEPMTLRASVAENSKTQVRAAAEEILKDKIAPTFAESLADGKGVVGATTSKIAPMLNNGGVTALDRRADVATQVGSALMQPPGKLPTAPADLSRQLMLLDTQANMLGNGFGRQFPLGIMLGSQQPTPGTKTRP